MTTHPELPVDLFDDFFHQLYGHSPFQWQTRSLPGKLSTKVLRQVSQSLPEATGT